MSVNKLILSKEYIEKNIKNIKNIISKADIIITIDNYSSNFIKNKKRVN